MRRQDIIRKLTSRKLWIAVAALVSGVMVYRGAPAESAERVGSLILQAAAVLGYCLGEGLADNGNGVIDVNEISCGEDGQIEVR